MAALGLGGLLGGRLRLRRPVTAGAIAAAIVAACVALTASHVIALVVLAQVVLVLLMVAVSIPLTASRLHDAMPSSIRAGVAPGVGTLTWLTFLPFAFVFGAVSDRSGVHTAGWTLGALALAHRPADGGGRPRLPACAQRRTARSRVKRPTPSNPRTTPTPATGSSLRRRGAVTGGSGA